MGEGIANLLRDLWGIGRPGKQHNLGVRIKLLGRSYEMDEALLASNPSHEHHGRLVKIDSKSRDGVSAWIWLEFLGINAVLYDMHLVGIKIGIGVQRVLAHSSTDRDHRIRCLEGGLLGPR